VKDRVPRVCQLRACAAGAPYHNLANASEVALKDPSPKFVRHHDKALGVPEESVGFRSFRGEDFATGSWLTYKDTSIVSVCNEEIS